MNLFDTPQHSAGPWTSTVERMPKGSNRVNVSVIGPDGQPVMMLVDATVPDVRLVRHAPELVEVAQDAFRLLVESGNGGMSTTIKLQQVLRAIKGM